MTTGLKADKWMTIVPGLLSFPAYLIMMIYLVWFMFARINTDEYTALKIIIILVAVIGVIMAYSLFTIAAFSPEDEPVRFCRADKKLYRYQASRWRCLGMDIYRFNRRANIEVFGWEHCRAEVVRKIITTGTTMRRDCFLEMAIIDPSSNKVIERFRVGDRDMFGKFTNRIFLWETIRRYMETGPAAVPQPVLMLHPATMGDCIDEFNPFSLPAKSAPGAQRILSYVLAALLWIISLPSIFAVLSRWTAGKLSGKVDWGASQEGAFSVPDERPAVNCTQRWSVEDSVLSRKESKRRKRAGLLWLVSIFLQISVLYWFFFTPSYYR